ncbi:hypothetical protein GCM10011309_05980 [Litorimonas cladophorae]|uniref:Lipoprotein n=1 Tax=Litorimonas cladophorae TaxID=1220491 RepID=A0A918KE95_9PROT|nr:hypothetical protein [Litorimonas cladophorae]GGX59190.1 hypothetical protein GCM10011309_05980 [Litorimonas cladophorae]
MKRLVLLSCVALAACSAEVQPPEPPVVPVSAESPMPKVRNMPAVPTIGASNVSDIDFDQYSPALAGVIGLTEGETRLEAVDKIRLFFAPEAGSTILSTASATFEGDDNAVMLFSVKGLPDDSVKAQEVYAVFTGPGGANKFNQSLAAYGMRIKCYRGSNTTEWQTDLCP